MHRRRAIKQTERESRSVIDLSAQRVVRVCSDHHIVHMSTDRPHCSLSRLAASSHSDLSGPVDASALPVSWVITRPPTDRPVAATVSRAACGQRYKDTIAAVCV